MIKLVLTILCGGISWEQVASDWSPNKDLPMRRKASLFLKNKAIPGFEVSSSEEYIAPRQFSDFFGSSESVFVNPELKSIVLGGNYPELKLKIVKPSMSQNPNNQEEDIDGKPIGKQELDKMLILLDPVEELLLRSNDTSTGNGTANNSGTDLEGRTISNTVKEGLKDFMKKLLECKVKIMFCKKKNLISCYLYCLLNDHPLGQIVKSNVQALIKTFCDPLGTVFDAGVKLFNMHFATIKTINNFLTVLRIVPETFKRFTRLAANALPAILLKYSDIEEAAHFKTVLSGLETDAKAMESMTDITTELSNPGCPKLDIFNAIQRTVGILYKYPKAVDVFLPGLWMISKLFHLISVPLIKIGLKAFGGALSILIGLNCGLAHYIQTGIGTTCEENDRVIWEATVEELVQPESGIPVVCGAVPYIPLRLLQDDTFPPIFNQQKELSEVGSAKDHSELAARDDISTKDMSWLDDVIKTLDADDNV